MAETITVDVNVVGETKPHLEDMPEEMLKKLESELENVEKKIENGEIPSTPVQGSTDSEPANEVVIAEAVTDHHVSLNLDDEKLAIFKKLREEISNEEIPDKQKPWLTDQCLCRYLRARQWNLQKAKQMLLGTVKWRAENGIDDLRSKDVESQIRMGHMYNMIRDNQGRPVMILRVHTERDPHTKEQKLNFMIYSMERAIKSMPPNVEQWVWLVSCKDYNFKYNGELGFAKELLSVLQNHFPERLGLLIVCDAPFMFKMFWKMIYPFIDEHTSKKVLFLSGGHETTGEKYTNLAKLMDMSQVEAGFAGTSSYKFDPDEYMKILQEEEKSW